MKPDPRRFFLLKRPCGNCPFLKEGAIGLAPGRLAGIIAELLRDDHQSFYCHKTVHRHDGGETDEEGRYHPSGNESMCAGAMIYLHKARRPTVLMRVGLHLQLYAVDDLEACFDLVIDPGDQV